MGKLRSRLLGAALSLVTLLAVGGCGGGGGGGGSTAAKSTVSGSVTFPSVGALVAKRAGAAVTDSTVTIEAWTADGKKIASVNPTYDDAAATKIYSYKFDNLDSNVDYVIKATKGGAVLKKLIGKLDVVSGAVPGQNLDGVSTVAVIVASQKVGFTIGNTLPAGKTLADLSTQIGTVIKPVLLEGTIATAVNGGKDALTSDTAKFANLFNVVVVSLSDSKDPAGVVAGTATLSSSAVQVPIISVSGATVTVTQTAPANLSAATASFTPTYTAPTETAKTYTDIAEGYLAKQDIANASLNYEKALSVDAADAKANFGGAITSGLMMMEDPDVQAIFTKWGEVAPTVNQVVQASSPVKLPFQNLTSIKILPKTTAKATAKSVASIAGSGSSTANMLAAFSALKSTLPKQKTGFKSLAKEVGLVTTISPSVGEMQTLITNVVIPRIDKVLARLAKVEGKNFSFTVTKAMQGNPAFGTDITYNDGEFYVLDTALNVFQVMFKFASSYTFLPSGFVADTVPQDPLSLINNPGFFTLRTGGASAMSTALTNARSAVTKAQNAFDVVKLRTLGQGTFDISGWTALEKTDFQAGLTKALNVLSGPYDIVNSTGTIKVDATKFFTNPLTRANLPTLGYDVPRNATLSAKYNDVVAGEIQRSYQYWNGTSYSTSTYTSAVYCNLEPTSDIPDYTLNGILPNNSAANNIAGFTGILPKIDGKLLTIPSGMPAINSFGRNFDGSKFYFYTYGTSASYIAYQLDAATGVFSQYYSSVTGGPASATFQGLRWYVDGMYAMYSAGSVYTYYPFSVAGGICTVNTSAPKASITVPAGRNNFRYDLDGTTYFISNSTVAPTYSPSYLPGSFSYILYSNVNPATSILSLSIPFYGGATPSAIGLRHKTLSVADPNEGTIEQYLIDASGTSTSKVGRYVNVDYNGFDRLIDASSGYYWVFDTYDNKLIKYAGKPDGSRL